MAISSLSFPPASYQPTASRLPERSSMSTISAPVDSSSLSSQRVLGIDLEKLRELPTFPKTQGFSQEQFRMSQQSLGKSEQKSQRKPKRNILQRSLIGAGKFGGKVLRGAGTASGTVLSAGIKNNPAALLSRGSSGLAKMAGADSLSRTLGGADRVSQKLGNGSKSLVRGVAEFGAGTVEGTTQMVATPVETVKSVGVLASSGLDAVPVVGKITSGAEAIVRGTDLETVREEKRQNRQAIVSGFVEDYKEKKQRIGKPGALVSTLLEVGVPTKLAQTGIRKASLANSRRLSKNDAFKNLPEQEQSIVRQMVSRNAPKVAGVKIPFWVGKAEQGFSALLKDGRLDGRLVDELQKLDRADTAKGLSRRRVFAETVETVGRPGVIHQGRKGTCAATTPQYDLAVQKPSEFVRVSRELTSKDGIVKTSRGDFARDSSGMAWDLSGRRPLDRVMQSSFMNHPHRYNADRRYINGKDAHFDGDNKKIHSGLYDTQSRDLRSALLDEDLIAQHFPRGGTKAEVSRARVAFEKDLETLLGEGASMQVGVKWGSGNHKYHAFTVEGVEGDFFVGRNPWGKGDKGQGGLERTMIDDEGRFRIHKDVFFENLDSYHRRPKDGDFF